MLHKKLWDISSDRYLNSLKCLSMEQGEIKALEENIQLNDQVDANSNDDGETNYNESQNVELQGNMTTNVKSKKKKKKKKKSNSSKETKEAIEITENDIKDKVVNNFAEKNTVIGTNAKVEKSKKDQKLNKNSDDLDEIISHIMGDDKPVSNSCSVPKCKQNLSILSHTCQYCNMKYCITHRHPESHSPKCAEKVKNSSKSEYKQESMRFITQERRDPGSTNAKKFNAEKSKEDLKKIYKEKLEHIKREERGKK
ncbi:DNA-binding protein smubp-2 [Gigaspora margarita]|uniref:DNA-binding protein smubp-2 n=1 Tax=Gigaspora margarita TaxID=4874 RepID=A0A8H3WY84_GIGMA|nr:DNA-binding protein smubp-2 [Gigaspora margarita]